MARKTKEDALVTRNILLDSAESVFFEKGFANTTLMDVANHAGLTRGAIYWHFKNKNDMFEAMVERVHLPIEQVAKACAAADEPDPLGKFREFSINFLLQVAHDRRQQQVFTVLLHKFEYNGQLAEMECKKEQSYNEFTDTIETILKNAIQRQQLPADLDTRKAAIIKHAYFSGILNNWLLFPQSFDLAGVAESLVDSFFFTLQHSPNLRLPPSA